MDAEEYPDIRERRNNARQYLRRVVRLATHGYGIQHVNLNNFEDAAWELEEEKISFEESGEVHEFSLHGASADVCADNCPHLRQVDGRFCGFLKNAIWCAGFLREKEKALSL